MRPNNPLASFIRRYGSIDPSLHSYQPRSERDSGVAGREMDKPPSTPIYDQFKARSTVTLATEQTQWPSWDQNTGQLREQKPRQRALTDQDEQATFQSLRSRTRKSSSQVDLTAYPKIRERSRVQREEPTRSVKEYDMQAFDFQVQPLSVVKKVKGVSPPSGMKQNAKHTHTLSPIIQSPTPLTHEYLREHTEREVLNAYLDGRHDLSHTHERSPISPKADTNPLDLYNYNPHATPPSQFDQRSLFPPFQPFPRQQDFQAYRYYTHTEVEQNHLNDQLRQSPGQTRTPSLIRSSSRTVSGEMRKSNTFTSSATHARRNEKDDDKSSEEVVYANGLTRGLFKLGRKAKKIYRKFQVAHEEEKRMAWIAWQHFVAENGEQLGLRPDA